MAPNWILGDNNDCGTTEMSRKQQEIDESMASDNRLNHRKESENYDVVNKTNFKHKLIRKFNQPRKRLLIIGWVGVLCVVVSYGIFKFDPLAMIVKMETEFAEGTLAYSYWKDPPVDLFIKVVMFNVTNSEEFLAGKEKLRFEEVGPFYYRETIRFTNVTFHNNGTVTYIPRRKLIPAPEMSDQDPDTLRVIVPNLPVIGIASMLHEFSMVTNSGYNFLLSYLDSQPFINVTVTEFFMGYEDKLVQLAGTFIPSWIPFKTFGLLERMFAEGENLVTTTIKPNVKDPMGTEDDADYNGQYLIDRFNGDTENPKLVANVPNRRKPNRCTFIQGTTDGTRINMNVNPNVTYWLYRKAFCRSLPIRYSHSVVTDRGYNAFSYKFMEGTFDSAKNNSSNFCFAKEDSTSSMPSGLSSMASCYYGIPAATSLPHFYKSDPSLIAAIEGMKPDASKHESQIFIQPDLGVVLEASIKIQMNVYMFNNRYITLTRPFNKMAVPLFWIDWYFDDLGKVYTFMNLVLYVVPWLNFCLIVILCLAGLVMLSFAVLGRIVSLRMDRAEGINSTKLQIIQQDSSNKLS